MKVMLFHDLVNTEVEEAEGLVLIGPAIKAAHAVLAHWVVEIFFLLLVLARHLSRGPLIFLQVVREYIHVALVELSVLGLFKELLIYGCPNHVIQDGVIMTESNFFNSR